MGSIAWVFRSGAAWSYGAALIDEEVQSGRNLLKYRCPYGHAFIKGSTILASLASSSPLSSSGISTALTSPLPSMT